MENKNIIRSEDEGWESLERTLVKKAHIFDLYEERLKLPDGSETVYDMLSHKGASGVVPVLPDGRILMVRQYRPAIHRYTLEIPAGGRDNREEPFEEAAIRELEEETGYKAGKLTHLVSLKTAIAFSDEQVEVFVATELYPGTANPDPEEFLAVKAYPLSELLKYIADGVIQDAKTVSALMSYKVLCV